MSNIQETDCCETEIYGETGCDTESEPKCDDECEGCDACDDTEQAAYDVFVTKSFTKPSILVAIAVEC
jgi:hypothetical protein